MSDKAKGSVNQTNNKLPPTYEQYQQQIKMASQNIQSYGQRSIESNFENHQEFQNVQGFQNRQESQNLQEFEDHEECQNHQEFQNRQGFEGHQELLKHSAASRTSSFVDSSSAQSPLHSPSILSSSLLDYNPYFFTPINNEIRFEGDFNFVHTQEARPQRTPAGRAVRGGAVAASSRSRAPGEQKSVSRSTRCRRSRKLIKRKRTTNCFSFDD